MDEDNVMSLRTRTRLTESVLGPYIPQYCSYLLARRYAANTRRFYVSCVAHFAYWVTNEQLDLSRIDEEIAKHFLSYHLPRCECPPPVHRQAREIRAALAHLFVVLRASGVIPVRTDDADHLKVELASFDHYMDQ